MENILRQKYKLPKPAARSIVAEAKSSLKMNPDVTYSKPLEQRCVKIAEERGFLENGKPIEKKPARTTWMPSQPTMKANDLRSRVTQILQDKPSDRSGATIADASTTDNTSVTKQVPVSQHRVPARKPERKPSNRVEGGPRKLKSRESSSSRRGSSSSLHKPTPSERPRRSRFVPSARVSKVLDPIVEASYSTDESDVGSVSSKRSTRSGRRRFRRNISLNTQSTKSSADESTLRGHILSIVGDCVDIDVISDHAKGFRATDFDSRSYTSLTVSTDGESVSSGGSGRWGGVSPTKSRNAVSMGPSTAKSLAMRFSNGSSDRVAAPPRPVRRHSNDDDEPPPIRVLGEPPIRVVETPARLVTGFP